MSNVLECTSCGGTNQLPEGKTSMFCAFCGNAIEKKQLHQIPPKDENLIKSKPKIIDNCLTLKNRKVNSLLEVSSWFSDDELEEIKTLDLTGNNISSLDGIEFFSGLQKLNLTDNNFTEIAANDINHVNNLILGDKSYGFELNLYGNPISSDSWVPKINVNEILNSYSGKIYFDSNHKVNYHTHYGSVALKIFTNNGTINEFHPKSYLHPNNSKSETKSKDINWILPTLYLLSPLLLGYAIKFVVSAVFSDDFISNKLAYGSGLFFSIMLVTNIMTGETKKVKTGKSFKTNNGLEFNEYKKRVTREGITLKKIYNNILYVHIAIGIIWLIMEFRKHI